MCTVSMIGDFYGDKFKYKYPNIFIQQPSQLGYQPPVITKQEFDALKKEVLDMKELLKRALKYDRDNGEPECQMEEKVAILKKVADLIGVELPI